MNIPLFAIVDTARTPDASPFGGWIWARRVCPYCVFAIGIFLGAGGIALFTTLPATPGQFSGYWLLGLALLTCCVAYTLVERDERAWLLLQFVGAACVGGMGFALLRLTALDIWLRLLGVNLLMPGNEILWFLTGLALLAWCVALLKSNGAACLLWQLATLPLAIIAFCWWHGLATIHLAQQEPPVLGMTVWFVLTGIGLLAVLHHERKLASHPRPRSVSPATRKPLPDEMPTKFPTRYHELLARGRFCEIFKVPCSTPCPLPMTVAAKYQRRRLKYRYYPEVLEAFEKAYAVLITPQTRDICRVAHDMMEMKEKQLGMKRFQEIEIILWGRLWKRLQDRELRANPPRDLQDKQRLLKELSQDLDD